MNRTADPSGTGPRWACVAIDLQEDLCRDPRRRHLVDAMLPNLQRLSKLAIGTSGTCLKVLLVP